MDTPQSFDPAAAGRALFDEAVRRYIQPELTRRLEDGRLAAGADISRFQVLRPGESRIEVRLNEEVGGTIEVEPSGEVVSYEPRPEDAGVPHVTAFGLAGVWTLSFDFGAGTPTTERLP